jgi:AAA15 family ATPase/GTPase
MSATKIGFNNFKAFGPKMQYFTKKPITLIYGPNSIGKSSLMRSLLYREYVKKPNMRDYGIKNIFTRELEYRNQSTDRFGDRFNIGTFENTVHMHDVSQSINYDIEYSDHLDIFRLIPMYQIFSNPTLLLFDSIGDHDIVDGVDACLTKNEDDYTENEKLIDKLIVSKCKKITSVNENDLEVPANVVRFSSFVHYALFQMLIKSVRVKSSVSNGLEVTHEVFFNDVLLLKCMVENYKDSIAKKQLIIELYTNNQVFDLVFFKPEGMDIQDKYTIYSDTSKLSKVQRIYVDLFTIEENYSVYLEEFVKLVLTRILLPNNDFENIYIGPIRQIPERNDFMGSHKFYKKQRRKQARIDKSFERCISLGKISYFLWKNKYFNFIYWMMWFPRVAFCALRKFIATFYNSLYVGTKGMPRYIKQNTNSNHYLWHSLFENKKVRNKVNEWLKDKGKHNSSYAINIGVRDDSIKGSSDGLKFIDESTKTYVHPQDMGVGISQSLPIIIASNLYEHANIFIEQPELHLHPKLQMEIADEFIRSIHENGNEFMLESHSEHMLLRIMKRMRQTAKGKLEDESLKLTPDDVCLLYVDSHKGKTFIRELDLDVDGTLLSRWPNGFFEDSYHEMFS